MLTQNRAIPTVFRDKTRLENDDGANGAGDRAAFGRHRLVRPLKGLNGSYSRSEAEGDHLDILLGIDASSN